MKKYIYSTVLLFVLFLSPSCVDLEQAPTSFITEEEYMQNIDVDALQKAVGALYKQLYQGGYGFNCCIQRISVAADDIDYSKTKPNNLLDFYAKLTPDLYGNEADLNKMWPSFFSVITSANKLINKTVIPTNEEDAKKFQEVLGEAYFMRGLAYFYTVRLFGDAPLILKEEDAYIEMPRNTVEDIYDKAIVPSLEQAIKWLPVKSRSGDSSTPSSAAAIACLADVYMTMAGWPLYRDGYYEKAAELTGNLIEKAADYGLKLTDEYSDLWLESKKQESNEHLFALHHSVAQGTPSNYGKSYYPIDFYNGGWADYYANETFFMNYPEDKRKKWNILDKWRTKTSGDQEVYYTETTDKLPVISKYFDYNNGAPGASPQSNGITSIYRYADVLLMYAEASTKATGSVSQKAIDAINEVQRRAGYEENGLSLTSTTNVNDFLDDVFDENGWEFFAEMRRWFDMVRLEKVEELRYMYWDKSLYKQYGHYYLPIYQEQINLTGWDNNPGY